MTTATELWHPKERKVHRSKERKRKIKERTTQTHYKYKTKERTTIKERTTQAHRKCKTNATLESPTPTISVLGNKEMWVSRLRWTTHTTESRIFRQRDSSSRRIVTWFSRTS
jgi:hypothetical protein